MEKCKGCYRKVILVDVPCITGHILPSNDNNVFKPTRIKERLQMPEVHRPEIDPRMPEVQSEILMDMMEALTPLKYLFEFDNMNLNYGHILVPTLQNNWGPMYFCKMTVPFIEDSEQQVCTRYVNISRNVVI